MKRRQFLGATAAGAATFSAFSAAKAAETYAHQNPTASDAMQKVIHRAETRGHANHGWLDSHHSFSFAGYYNPERERFGMLRVLNDDIVQGGKGFSLHPHKNMEIVSIPLKGALRHEDTEKNARIIKTGDVQIMSAGRGIYHSEFNNSAEEAVNFLQIWVFPRQADIQPRYQQITPEPEGRRNQLQTVVAPDDQRALWVNQNVWFHLAEYQEATQEAYRIRRENNGVYAFLVEGHATIGGEQLQKRDAIGLWNTSEIALEAEAGSQLLLIDVPMG